jgi:vesicle coat complex subunit
VKEDEDSFKAQAEIQMNEIEDLQKQLAEAKEKCALAEANREISEYWKNHLEKTVEELHASKERCFEKSLDCVKKIKTSFANVGAYSSEENFIRGDPEGVIEWISGEAEAFEEILSDRADVCTFSGARGILAILEKARCDHIKTLAQAEAAFSVDDTKDPSAEASLMGGKFYNGIWVNGGQEMAHEIMKKSEKDIHDAWVEAKQAEEAAKREKCIGTIFWCSASEFVFCGFVLIDFSTVAELSPPPEPFDPLADPETKEALQIINMAKSIVDEVVNKLLNEVAEKILKED